MYGKCYFCILSLPTIHCLCVCDPFSNLVFATFFRQPLAVHSREVNWRTLFGLDRGVLCLAFDRVELCLAFGRVVLCLDFGRVVLCLAFGRVVLCLAFDSVLVGRH